MRPVCIPKLSLSTDIIHSLRRERDTRTFEPHDEGSAGRGRCFHGHITRLGLIIFVLLSKVTGKLFGVFLLSESYIDKGTRFFFVISELQRFKFRKIKTLVYLFPCTTSQNTEKLSLDYLVAYAQTMSFSCNIHVSVYVNSEHQSPR